MDIASVIRLIVLAAIWGGSFIFTRIGVPVFGPAALIALRVGLAALFLGVVALVAKRPAGWRRRWRLYLIIGAFNCSLPFVLYAYAAESLNASLLAIVNATAPISGALVAAVWLRTPLSRVTTVGLALGLAGVALIVGGSAGTREPGWALALAAAFAAPVCYGIASSYTRIYADGIDPFDIAHSSMWGSTLLALPLCLFVPVTQTSLPFDWIVVTALAMLCTGVAYVLYFRLIRDVGPARALTVTFLVPVFGVLWGVLFLDESVSWTMIVGGMIVLLGTALSNGLLPSRAASMTRPLQQPCVRASDEYANCLSRTGSSPDRVDRERLCDSGVYRRADAGRRPGYGQTAGCLAIFRLWPGA